MNRRMPLLICAGLLILVLFGAQASRFSHIVEDSYISFRYARNLADGLGPVFNPGERVEGYSSPLWVLLLSIPARFGASIPWSSQALGLAAALLTLLACFGLTGQLCGERGIDPALCLAAPFLLAAWPAFSVWPLSGMETSLFTLLVTATAWAWLRPAPGVPGAARTRRPRAAHILLLLACLARPEACLLALILIPAGWVRRYRAAGVIRAAIDIRDLLFVLLPLAAFELWRYSYYGYLLPNSFYAKYGFGRQHLRIGLEYAWAFLGSGLGFLFVLPPAAWFFLKAFRKDLWVPLFVLLYIACVAYLGGDIYPFSRYFMPIVPISLGATTSFLSRLSRRSDGTRRPVVLLAFLPLLWLAHPPGLGTENENYAFLRNNDQGRMRFARLFAGRLHKGDTIALSDAGILPFRFAVPTTDMIGLNDEHIAHRSVPAYEPGLFGHEKHDAGYVFRRRPAYVFFVLHQWNTSQVSFPWIRQGRNLLFQDTYPIVQYGQSQYPAQTALWELPDFKLYYRPTAFYYGHEVIVFYELDRQLAPILDKAASAPLTEAEEDFVASRFLRKGCFREGEDFLRRAAGRGAIRSEALEAYQRDMRALPADVLRQYDQARDAMIDRRLRIARSLLQGGRPDEAGDALRRADALYPGTPAIRAAWADYLAATGQSHWPGVRTPR